MVRRAITVVVVGALLLALAAGTAFAAVNGSFGPGDDTVFGTNGNDRINGQGGNDILFGLRGNDLLRGGPGQDRIFGGPGRDRIYGGAGRDRMFGGPGNDRIFSFDGKRDVVFCGGGSDFASVDEFDFVSPSCELVAEAVVN